jgi:hypothetical protein
MDLLQVPDPVREKLGERGAEGLIEMFAVCQQILTEWFERRLAHEIGSLRLEMHQGFAGMRTEMAQLENASDQMVVCLLDRRRRCAVGAGCRPDLLPQSLTRPAFVHGYS